MKAACLRIERGMPETEYDAEYLHIKDILSCHSVALVDGGRVAEEWQAESAVAGLMQQKPDIMLLLVFTGRTAPVIDAAARASAVPVLIWAIGRDFSFPSSALAGGALKESSTLFRLVHGEPDDGKTISSIMETIRVSSAVVKLRRSKMGLVGGLFFNLISCRYDPAVVTGKFGIDLKPVSYEEIQELMVHAKENEKGLEDLERLCCLYSLKTPLEKLRPGLELHMALKRLAEEKGFDAFAVECWTGLPKALGLNPCLGFIVDSYVIACEGDAVMGVMLLAIRYMTGAIPFACDVQHIDGNNVATVCHCGASPSLTCGDVILDLSPVALRQGFNTVTCRPELANGFVTMVRLYGSVCDRMHIACGEIISCDRRESLTVSIKLHGDRAAFIEECTGNHYIVASGDIREELHLFANWMKINIKET